MSITAQALEHKKYINYLQKKKNIIDQVMGDGDFSESFAQSILKEIL